MPTQFHGWHLQRKQAAHSGKKHRDFCGVAAAPAWIFFGRDSPSGFRHLDNRIYLLRAICCPWDLRCCQGKAIRGCFIGMLRNSLVFHLPRGAVRRHFIARQISCYLVHTSLPKCRHARDLPGSDVDVEKRDAHPLKVLTLRLAIRSGTKPLSYPATRRVVMFTCRDLPTPEGPWKPPITGMTPRG